jgi:hypothetical protein
MLAYTPCGLLSEKERMTGGGHPFIRICPAYFILKDSLNMR